MKFKIVHNYEDECGSGKYICLPVFRFFYKDENKKFHLIYHDREKRLVYRDGTYVGWYKP